MNSMLRRRYSLFQPPMRAVNYFCRSADLIVAAQASDDKLAALPEKWHKPIANVPTVVGVTR